MAGFVERPLLPADTKTVRIQPWLTMLAGLIVLGIGLASTSDGPRDVGDYLGGVGLVLLAVGAIGLLIELVQRGRWLVLLWMSWLLPYSAFVVGRPEGIWGVVARVWLLAATIGLIGYGVAALWRRQHRPQQ